jgi:hypothetical protein
MTSATRGGAGGQAAQAGDELVVSESTAAFLLRQRAAEVIEIIEAPAADHRGEHAPGTDRAP